MRTCRVIKGRLELTGGIGAGECIVQHAEGAPFIDALRALFKALAHADFAREFQTSPKATDTKRPANFVLAGRFARQCERRESETRRLGAQRVKGSVK